MIENNELVELHGNAITDVSELAIQERVDRTREALVKFFTETRRENTERSYFSALRYFWAWAWLTYGANKPEYPIPEDVLVKFTADHLLGMDADVEDAMIELNIKQKKGVLKLSTVRARLWALQRAHAENGVETDVYTFKVCEVLKRSRDLFSNKKKKASPIDTQHLSKFRGVLDVENNPKDRLFDVMVTVAFAAGGLRRSELTGLRWEDIQKQVTDEAPGYRFVIALQQAKTQKASDSVEWLPVRGEAAKCFERWQNWCKNRCDTKSGPVFRKVQHSGTLLEDGVTDIWFFRKIKEVALRAGFDPHEYSPHSIRSGFITEAHRRGYPIKDVMDMSRHKSIAVHLGYVRDELRMSGGAGCIMDTDEDD